MELTIHLDKNLEKRLSWASTKERKPKKDILLEALIEHLENIEDMIAAKKALKTPGKAISWEKVKKKHGLED